MDNENTIQSTYSDIYSWESKFRNENGRCLYKCTIAPPPATRMTLSKLWYYTVACRILYTKYIPLEYKTDIFIAERMHDDCGISMSTSLSYVKKYRSGNHSMWKDFPSGRIIKFDYDGPTNANTSMALNVCEGIYKVYIMSYKIFWYIVSNMSCEVRVM